MHKTKPEKYLVSPSAQESIARGLPVIEGFPSPGCRFVLDQTIEIEANEYWPLAMGCVENGVGEPRTALVAISEQNRLMSRLHHAMGKPCVDATFLYM